MATYVSMIRAALALVLWATSFGLLAFAQAPGTLGCDMQPLGRMPLLMPDDFSEMNLVTWRVERGTPDPNNPLIEGEMPWDAGGVGIHSSVFKDPLDGKWKAYLVCTPAGFYPREDPWKSDNSAYRRICLFESDDGVHWTRAELSNVSLDEYAKTNAIFDIDEGVSAYPSVLIDPKNTVWPYSMIVLREAQDGSPADGPPPQGKGNGYYRYRSRDGRRWELVGKVEGPMAGDVAFFYRNPEGGYVCYHRIEGTRQATDHVPCYEYCARRTCYRATSRDGNTWTTDPEMALTADERDHRDTQYQECVPLKVQGGYLGMITMYHPITQTLNLRIAASRDGRHWWFPDRVPCLDNAPLGEYGGGMIWQSQNLIVQGKTLYVYYGGTEGVHRQISDSRAPSIPINSMETVTKEPGYFIPFNAALCRASWRVDRMYALISAAGGSTVGAAVTTPRQIGGQTLWVNLQTRPPKKSAKTGLDEGYLLVELLDKDGVCLPGFTQADCAPVKGDHDAIQVHWAGGDKTPRHARKAKFYLKRTFLYGFEFRSDKADGWPQRESTRSAH